MIEPKSATPPPYRRDATIQPGVPPAHPATTTAEMESSMALLSSRKDAWARTPAGERVRLLDAIRDAFAPVCDAWVQLGLEAKGAQSDLYASGWEWGSGPLPILRYLRALKRTWLAIATSGRPPLPGPLAVRPNGQVSLRVYPTDLYERLTTPSTTVDVWMEPGLSPQAVLNARAAPYAPEARTGKVCLVLGAGNISGIAFTDTLSKLFVDNSVVLLKMNPVNDYLGALIQAALAPLISAGYLQLAYGGAAEGAYLVHHPAIDCIHITGSHTTYEAIVFGTDPEASRRKLQHAPLCTKRITAELGNVGPAIVVPGPWSKQDVRYQAEQLAANLCDAGSYTCSRARVIVQHADWPNGSQLLDQLQTTLSRIQQRVAYYPGAGRLYQRFISAHPGARMCGGAVEGGLPWTLIPDVDPAHADDPCFTTESFCPVMAATQLEAPSPAEFVARAVDFANSRLWGSLTAAIIVHPDSLRDPAVGQAVEVAIERLQYGVVAVNCLPGLAWAMAVPPWGSFPGNEPWDIQSGAGFVNNAYLLPRVQKTVLRAPFRSWPVPVWFPSRAKAMAKICQRVASYEARPSPARMLGIVAAALR